MRPKGLSCSTILDERIAAASAADSVRPVCPDSITARRTFNREIVRLGLSRSLDRISRSLDLNGAIVPASSSSELSSRSGKKLSLR